ncbi:MAG: M20/M25/M40 family metallo-hydrolase [Anaerolineales bacterium]|nr:M20/M25/M40 family metallo-hydrolase [Anaerolineales bacterium]
MEDTKTLLTALTAVPGLSGHESLIRKQLTDLWEPLTDELHTSPIGSLHGLKKGSSPVPRPSILIATHMDAIGLMVSGIEDGLLRVTNIGGIDNRVLPGLTVTIHSQSGDLPGLVVLPPAHTLPEDQKTSTVDLKYLFVDTGLLPREVSSKIQIGDLVTFSLEAMDLGDGYLTAPAIDNRASVAALTEALKILQTRKHRWDVWAAATVQEEVGLYGAQTTGFDLRPSLAVVIDVTFGSGPGAAGYETLDMDKGPSFDIGPSTHPKLYEAFIRFAAKQEIPFQRYAYPRSSGTDADKLQISAEGVITMIISIPIRYMHTPVELVQVRDIQRTARLIAGFIEQLDDDFLESLKWEEETGGAR